MGEETRKRRVPSGRRIEAHAKRTRVIELRESNVPIRLIAQNLKLSEAEVRTIIREDYRRNQDWASLSNSIRKYEREKQLEATDFLVSSITRIDPLKPGELSKANLTIRDWLAAVNTSVQIKDRLIRLHGLDGQTAATDPSGAGQLDPGDPVAEARVIRDFVDSLAGTHPEIHRAIIHALTGEEVVHVQPGRVEEIGGGDTPADGPGEGAPASPAGAPDP